jgi:hypothetical protein
MSSSLVVFESTTNEQGRDRHVLDLQPDTPEFLVEANTRGSPPPGW